jgi:hypothetical protein
MLGLRCGRALKNQSAGSSKAMRWRTEAMTRKGVKLYDIIRIQGSTLKIQINFTNSGKQSQD